VDVFNGDAKSLKEESVEKSNIIVTIKSDVFLGILVKKMNPVTSFMTGKKRLKALWVI
jgi:putative sterol carrier protein